MAKELEGKTAIVTGAGSGFGRAIASLFAAEGATVFIADLDGSAADAAAEAIVAQGAEARAHRVDVTRRRDVDELVDAAIAQAGRIDILVNNAGYTHARAAPEDVTEEDYDRVFAVNMKSVFHFVRKVSPLMKSARQGSIINIASTAVRRPGGALTWYAASKGALMTATQSLAVDLGPHNVRVNAISPVVGETGLLTRFTGAEDTPEARRRFTATIPLGRYCTPDDVASAALYLASPRSAFITGTALDVDGGFLAGNYLRS